MKTKKPNICTIQDTKTNLLKIEHSYIQLRYDICFVNLNPNRT